MQETIAEIVYPILLRGLELQEQLVRGEASDFETERAALREQLIDPDALRWVEFGGDATTRSHDGIQPPDLFLGSCYALTCWLDEIFIRDSPWSDRWRERNLETDLYGARESTARFWDQAKKAEDCPAALAVYYLCVMLGFRGALNEQPEKLRAWQDASLPRVARTFGKPYTMPAEQPPPVNVRPLRGRARMQRMVLVGLLYLLLVGPLMGALLYRRFGP